MSTTLPASLPVSEDFKRGFERARKRVIESAIDRSKVRLYLRHAEADGPDYGDAPSEMREHAHGYRTFMRLYADTHNSDAFLAITVLDRRLCPVCGRGLLYEYPGAWVHDSIADDQDHGFGTIDDGYDVEYDADGVLCGGTGGWAVHRRAHARTHAEANGNFDGATQ